MTLMEMKELGRLKDGRLAWLHQCSFGRYEPQTNHPRKHTIPFTRVPTGAIATCPYCGSVKHTKEQA